MSEAGELDSPGRRLKVDSLRTGPPLFVGGSPTPSPRPLPLIKAPTIPDLKLRGKFSTVVSRVFQMGKGGSGRLKGLWPFHNEKTPSFHVNTEKGFYKCFGCGKAGDAITFVCDTEQLKFSEAVETIGKRFGIVIEYEEGS